MSLLLDKFHRFGDSVHQFYSKVSLAFSVKIALLGSVSWLFASGIAVFVDPLLEPTRSKLYGISSNYPLGLGIFAVGIPIFILLQRGRSTTDGGGTLPPRRTPPSGSTCYIGTDIMIL